MWVFLMVSRWRVGLGFGFVRFLLSYDGFWGIWGLRVAASQRWLVHWLVPWPELWFWALCSGLGSGPVSGLNSVAGAGPGLGVGLCPGPLLGLGSWLGPEPWLWL